MARAEARCGSGSAPASPSASQRQASFPLPSRNQRHTSRPAVIVRRPSARPAVRVLSLAGILGCGASTVRRGCSRISASFSNIAHLLTPHLRGRSVSGPGQPAGNLTRLSPSRSISKCLGNTDPVGCAGPALPQRVLPMSLGLGSDLVWVGLRWIAVRTTSWCDSDRHIRLPQMRVKRLRYPPGRITAILSPRDRRRRCRTTRILRLPAA